MKSLVVGAGAGISAALISALGKIGAGWLSAGAESRHQRIKPRGLSRFDSAFHREHWPATVTSSRKTRNPADPSQAYLIARAEAKRAHRAEKLNRDMCRCYFKNDAHGCNPTFDPYYIAQ